MVVGFTGTRKGMSDAQLRQAGLVLSLLRSDAAGTRNEFHFGGALGADREALRIARMLNYQIHWHPCPGVVIEDDARAMGEIVYEVFPPLRRDRDIVVMCRVLVAAPETDREVQRSGTWATVRYARRAVKPVVMLSRG